MAISKPTWLRNWLSKLNWDIFTWKLYIGDAIENGIDWVITWINLQVEMVDRAQSAADLAYDKALEVDTSLRKDIALDLSEVYQELDKLESELSEQWKGVFEAFEKAVNKFISDLDARTDYLEYIVAELSKWWDNFRFNILPLLPTKQEVEDVLKAETDPIKKEVEKHGNIFTWAWDLLTDPMKFLYDRAEEFFERFW